MAVTSNNNDAMSHAPAEGASDNSDKAGAAAPVTRLQLPPKKPHFRDHYIALGKLDSKVLETALGNMPLELLQYVALYVCDLYVAYKVYGGEDRHRDYQTMEGVFIRMRNGNKAPETAELGKLDEGRCDKIAGWLSQLKGKGRHR